MYLFLSAFASLREVLIINEVALKYWFTKLPRVLFYFLKIIIAAPPCQAFVIHLFKAPKLPKARPLKTPRKLIVKIHKSLIFKDFFIYTICKTLFNSKLCSALTVALFLHFVKN
jgi:hypothetical protein